MRRSLTALSENHQFLSYQIKQLLCKIGSTRFYEIEKITLQAAMIFSELQKVEYKYLDIQAQACQ